MDKIKDPTTWDGVIPGDKEDKAFMKSLKPKFSRRRYGNTTFTWIHFVDNNDKVFTPRVDPYQGRRPKDFIVYALQNILDGNYYEKE